MALSLSSSLSLSLTYPLIHWPTQLAGTGEGGGGSGGGGGGKGGTTEHDIGI